MSLSAIALGIAKSPGTPVLGLATVVLGLAEFENSMLVAFVAMVGGGGLLILAWFANSVKRVMERWLDTQGQKLIDLPTAIQLAEDKKGLKEALHEFMESAAEDRIEIQKFRLALAATLADHGARITGLERRQRATGEILRQGGE